MTEVIKMRGGHYRLYFGPRVGDYALVYDDVTVQFRDAWPYKTNGVVFKVQPTTHQIMMLVGGLSYEDDK